MIIKSVEKKAKAISAFLDKEWETANINRFGENLPWIEKEEHIVALEEERIVGYLHYAYKGGVMEIAEIIIADNRQREGIGTALLKEADRIAAKLGAHKLYVLTGMGEGAVRFYKSNGYKITGSIKNHYRNVDMVELSKLLIKEE